MSDLAALPNFVAGAVLHGQACNAGEFSAKEKVLVDPWPEECREISERIALWHGSKSSNPWKPRAS
jgi:hypothetical protein